MEQPRPLSFFLCLRRKTRSARRKDTRRFSREGLRTSKNLPLTRLTGVFRGRSLLQQTLHPKTLRVSVSPSPPCLAPQALARGSPRKATEHRPPPCRRCTGKVPGISENGRPPPPPSGPAVRLLERARGWRVLFQGGIDACKTRVSRVFSVISRHERRCGFSCAGGGHHGSPIR